MGAVDLLSQANARIDGVAGGDQAGCRAAVAGDVNGDGFSDVIVSTCLPSDNNARLDSGSVYVVFGRPSIGSVDLASLGAKGFRIDGADADDQLGAAAASAGDVNGDGLSDVIVSSENADNNFRGNSGSAYVVFGKSNATTVDLASLGTQGFRIDGAVASDAIGATVSQAGDMNGDGRSDVAVGAIHVGNDTTGRPSAGAVYVVFGKASTGNIDLASLGAGGFRIDGAAPFNHAGDAVAHAGDVNGDGRPDVIVGAPIATNGGIFSGAAYVVFGKSSSTAVDLATLGIQGFGIDGASTNDFAGGSVSRVGDMNGDGLADVIVGAIGAKSAYVVFGKSSPDTISLAAPGSHGFVIADAAPTSNFGGSASQAGDVNGDGRSDVIVGDSAAGWNGRPLSGAAYVVFGKAGNGAVDVASLGAQGFEIGGAANNDAAGQWVSDAGDVNGDGRADVIVGATLADNNGRLNSGSAYIVYGFGAPELSYEPSSVSVQAGTAIAPMTPITKHTGPATFDVYPALPPGLTLDATTGVVSGAPTTPQATTTHTVTMSDLVGTASADVSFTVGTLAPSEDNPCVRLTSGPVLSSVSRWKRLSGGGQARVRGPIGGLALRSWAGSVAFRIQTKQMVGRSRAVKQATFMLDGKRIGIDRRAPFSMPVTARTIGLGRHTVKVLLRRSRSRGTLKYPLFAAYCRPTRFSVAMSTKKPGASPNLKLLAQTYGPQLASARFALPKGLKVAVQPGKKGKRRAIGTLRLSMANGQRRTLKLSLPAKSGSRLVLLSSGGTQVGMTVGSKRALSISGLPPHVTQVSIKLSGKRARMLTNPRRCSRLRYRANLADRLGTSLTLDNGARVC